MGPRKQVRGWNGKKQSIAFLPLMRDNKQSNSTAYGGVQAGRCSKRPLRSLPYGVTNCCFFGGFFLRCDREVHQKRSWKGGGEKKKTDLGRKWELFWCCILWLASKLSLKGARPFSWYRLIRGNRPLNLARRALLRAAVLGVDVIRLEEDIRSESRVTPEDRNHRQQRCSSWSFGSRIETLCDTEDAHLGCVLPAALRAVACSR